MAWSTPRTWSIGEVVTASMMNTHIRDQLRYLKGLDGAVTLDDRMNLPPTSGTNGKGLRIGDATNQYANFQGLDLSGSSYIFFSTNRYFDGTGWQQLNTRAGGNLQISQDNLSYFTFAASSSTATERFRITNDGSIASGTSSPQGKMHLVGTLGRWLMYEYDGLDGTTQVIIPNGAGDVLYGVQLWSIVRTSSGIVQVANAGGSAIALGGTGALYSDGGTNVAQFRVLANGQIEIQRTLGSLTYKVALMIQWI
ncbi:hypothetical protein SE17_02285 [Kouleothrix aurantiaca]|uniref:Uncharacterized protein n=1 Tax=Kouleothrix aurantiaca TaxID=186479 RepID=A0A0P9DGP0_9CHLR|nr:hypothetical protein SE17_02285 [Kouleothrix aurantiaca]